MGARDLITPEAMDVARQLGIQVVREDQTRGQSRRPPLEPPALPPLKVARRGETALEPFGSGAVGVTVALRDVVTAR